MLENRNTQNVKKGIVQRHLRVFPQQSIPSLLGINITVLGAYCAPIRIPTRGEHHAHRNLHGRD